MYSILVLLALGAPFLASAHSLGDALVPHNVSLHPINVRNTSIQALKSLPLLTSLLKVTDGPVYTCASMFTGCYYSDPVSGYKFKIFTFGSENTVSKDVQFYGTLYDGRYTFFDATPYGGYYLHHEYGYYSYNGINKGFSIGNFNPDHECYIYSI